MLINSEEKKYDACPICASGIKTWRVKPVGERRYCLDICPSCGYSFVNPRPSLPFLLNYYASCGHPDRQDDKAAHDYKRVLEQELNDPNSLTDAARVIKVIKSLSKNEKGNRFLDVGCGFGFFSKEALNVGFEVTALELCENDRKIAEAMTGVAPVAGSFEAFECASASLSVILMSQILEHASDVNQWMKKSHDLLAANGIIAIALPNFGSIFRKLLQEKDPYICPPAHLNFFNAGSLSRLLEKHGFKVEAIQWISRIPGKSFQKRLPHISKPLLPIISMVSLTMLKLIDALRLGMMINVYARKI